MDAQDFWVVIVIGFCFQAQILSSQNLTCNPNDVKALEDFTSNLKTVIHGWGSSFSSDCCKWEGITCNSSSFRVVKLELPSKRLAGNLSASLGTLDQLRTLNLSQNYLIELLDLSFNDFSGPIPFGIDLPSIKFLDISQNLLNGSLPGSICDNNSTQLRVLNVAANYFSGNLPPGFGNCTSLEDLDLSTNYLTGTDDGISKALFRLPKLTQLSIQDNNLAEPLSEEIGNLVNLVRLDISRNGFSGTIPDVFYSLGRLQNFVAHSNRFGGQIPPSLSSSSTLSLLNLRNNSLQGSIALNCSAMISLTSLDLGSNKFDGPIPSNLPSCRHLSDVNLARNNFTGEIPESFKNFHSLSYLSLSNSSLSNISYVLQILQQCQNLTALVLTLNFRGEQFPADPTLHFEKLTGVIPQWLSTSSRLQLLDISWNQLEGIIPVWFGNFSNLFYLDISNNSLSGEIPRSITGLQCLIAGRISIEEPSPVFPLFMWMNVSGRGLHLQYNKVWSLRPTLDFSNNNLSGAIWPDFRKLRLLHVLDLNNNRLSGPIPSSLSKMVNLEILDLSHNELSGIIPPSLVDLASFSKRFAIPPNPRSRTIPTYTYTTNRQKEGLICVRINLASDPYSRSIFDLLSSSFEGNNLCRYDVAPCPSGQDDPLGTWYGKSSKDYTGVIAGVCFGFVFGIACFIGIDRREKGGEVKRVEDREEVGRGGGGRDQGSEGLTMRRREGGRVGEGRR
ncbi:phytosulfokine receptor 1-like [Pyrus ussuriensis x Pyrus communis]|uniref:Phytosulfokine receptor 1-like n=1 Tax=Pyrus ussuriensis x Pyrus communis TaxID=2448454 RepID=A0A5N5H7J1_9ROSA|nr:phytosulfokine receptor 1-like [Pyrus ussuriensis x Pyrus communis]